MSDICVINSKVFDLLPLTARLGKKVFHPGKEEESWQKKKRGRKNHLAFFMSVLLCQQFSFARGVKKCFDVVSWLEVGFESDDKLPLNCPFMKVMRASRKLLT